MPRFATNRWWTFILALSLGLTLMVVGPSRRAYADSPMGVITELGDYNGNTGGGGAPPPAYGDPDLPIGSGKGVKPGGVARPTGSVNVRAVGDSRTVGNAVMLRLQIVLSVLKGLYLR